MSQELFHTPVVNEVEQQIDNSVLLSCFTHKRDELIKLTVLAYTVTQENGKLKIVFE